jgi:tRNA threonylcarbamoyladenosine biosynthesis protein TsaE
VSRSVEETERLGEALAASLQPGDVLLLSGPLGAGKSRLVAGMARGLGYRGAVRSPTFTLINHYAARLPLDHVDLYRLESSEIPGLGLEDAAEDAVIVVEWGEKLIGPLAQDALRISIEILEGDRRRLSAAAEPDGRGASLLAAWRAAVGRA